MQQPSLITYSQGVVSRFVLAVFLVCQNQQGLVKKHLLSFKAANSMFFLIFSLVSSIPVKASNLLPINHFCILLSYTIKSSANKRMLSDWLSAALQTSPNCSVSSDKSSGFLNTSISGMRCISTDFSRIDTSPKRLSGATPTGQLG